MHANVRSNTSFFLDWLFEDRLAVVDTASDARCSGRTSPMQNTQVRDKDVMPHADSLHQLSNLHLANVPFLQDQD
jgi:hypothetical protein